MGHLVGYHNSLVLIFHFLFVRIVQKYNLADNATIKVNPTQISDQMYYLINCYGYLFDGMRNQIARRVPHGTVWDARSLGLQVEHVVPGFHVLRAEMQRIESFHKSITKHLQFHTHHLER